VARCGGQRPLDVVPAPQTASAPASPVGAGQPGADPAVGAFERVGAGGLDGVQPGLTRDRAELGRLAQARRARAGQGAAADLDDDVVHGGARELRGQLVGDGLAALDRQAVLAALAGERHGPGRKLPPQPEVGGIPGHSRLTRAGHDVAAEPAQPVHDAGLRIGRDEDAKPAAAGPGDHGRRERGVPAARDREVGAAVGQPEPLGHLEVDQQPHQVAGLVRARYVTGLVLDPHPAARREAEPVAHQRAPAQRRDPEAAGVHGGHRPPQGPDEPQVLVVAQPGVRRQVVGVHERPVAGERVGLAAGGEGKRRGVQDADQDVVDVAGVFGSTGGVGAPERVRLGGGRRPAAAGAAHGREHGGYRSSVTRVRALNSSMRPSQLASRSRRSTQ
jgi:hypothetical protein